MPTQKCSYHSLVKGLSLQQMKLSQKSIVEYNAEFNRLRLAPKYTSVSQLLHLWLRNNHRRGRVVGTRLPASEAVSQRNKQDNNNGNIKAMQCGMGKLCGVPPIDKIFRQLINPGRKVWTSPWDEAPIPVVQCRMVSFKTIYIKTEDQQFVVLFVHLHTNIHRKNR